MERSADVVVIGGGVIGCAVAYELARRGVGVTVLERRRVGCEASSAAAGMLAPLSEAHARGPFVDLALEALRRYPDLAAAVREDSGIDVEYQRSGIIRPAVDADDLPALRDRMEWQRGLLPLQWLEGEDVRRLEPALSPEVPAAIFSPEEAQLRPGRLVEALAVAAANRGAVVEEGVEVDGLLEDGSRVAGVRAGLRRWSAGAVVLASGAWSGLYGSWLGLPLPVRPVKGQILAVHKRPAGLRHIVFSARGYLAPKVDGTVLVGATQEEAGFDKRVTAEALHRLLGVIPALVPGLAGAEFRSAWAGLRPGTPDGLPVLGPAPGREGLLLATGHFRNGVLMAPVTANIIADLITEGASPVPLDPFQPARFREGS